MAVHLLLQEARMHWALERGRIFCDRIGTIPMIPAQMQSYYRFTRNCIMYLTDLLEEEIDHPTQQRRGISSAVQIFTTLKYYSQDPNFTTTGILTEVSEPSVSKILHRVMREICNKREQFIKFPVTERRIRKTLT